MRPVAAALLAVAAGTSVGASARGLAGGPAERAMIALVVVLGAAPCVAASLAAGDRPLAARLRRGAVVTATAFASAWAAAAVAGAPALAGAAAVVAGATALALGAAELCRARGVAPARAVFAGAAAPAVLAGAIFVADPFIEWRGSETSGAPARAALVLSANPVASVGADARVDWQRSPWLYSGPRAGAAGLSIVGAYYPSRPTSPFAWALAAGLAATAALAAARPRSTIPA